MYKEISSVGHECLSSEEVLYFPKADIYIVPTKLVESFVAGNPDKVFFSHDELRVSIGGQIDATALKAILMMKRAFHPAELVNSFKFKPATLLDITEKAGSPEAIACVERFK